MATITYKCDTCNRQVELLENKQGFTAFAQCTITSGCRGKFYKIKRNPNNSRESFPNYRADVEDYSPRKYLFVYKQEVASKVWKVVHNFGLSCVAIVYDSNGDIIPSSKYQIEYSSDYVTITFPDNVTGYTHILFRSTSLNISSQTQVPADLQISYFNKITFAIPKYITRISSAGAPLTPQATPTPTQTALPSPAPYEICGNEIKIEIELQRPNQEPILCTETLDGDIATDSPWSGFPRILVRNRKHYCLRTIDLTKLKIFTNTNQSKINIPDGTVLKIKRIDYGTGVLTNIPDRGLLIMLAEKPYSKLNKLLNKIVECGEIVGTDNDSFVFYNEILYANEQQTESVYPDITNYSP